jgi:UDP:flavonoid glycosyltransferase YjiC (YdhE family)
LWGKELNRLGIGGKTFNRRNVTSKKIAQEIRSVLKNKYMAENAMIIGKKLKNEDGVKNAVKIIEDILSKKNA